MLKKIGLFALIGVVVAGIIGYKMWFKEHATIGEPQFKVTASELLEAFKADEAAAQKKFVGTTEKPIVTAVSGKITLVKQDTTGILLMLEAGDIMSGVSCTLDKFSPQSRTDFKEGETVVVKGLVSGYLTDVVVDRCIFLSNN